MIQNVPADLARPALDGCTSAPSISAWFAGPKGENADWFGGWVERILSDYYAWRRNHFPEDGVVVDSAARRDAEPFRDAFEDRLIELLGRLKHDVPFQSPRYAGHMIAEQTLPAIAGYFAAMLYNPNNVSSDAAPVTVRLELEAAGMIAEMLGHPRDGWAHLTGGGTAANLEALWIARCVKYLPLVVEEARRELGLGSSRPIESRTDRLRALGTPSREALADYERLFHDAGHRLGRGPATTGAVNRALRRSRFHPGHRGMASVVQSLGSSPVLLAPETHHYCFDKAADLLGIGRDSLIRVRVDSQFRMEPDDLAAKLDDIDRRGGHVLGVVAVAGTTEEGAVDPVDQILALRAERESRGLPSFWVHADAAYGGYLRTLTRPARGGLGPPLSRVCIRGAVRDLPLELPHRHACDALERLGECESITIDPHKFGYIPYPAGCISFRSNLVKPLARQDAPYFSDPASDPETERKDGSIGVYALEGSRPGAAAAAVWLSHTLIPLDSGGHGSLIRQTIRNACELCALLEEYPGLVREAGGEEPPVRAVCPCAPGSNIVCFAFAPARPDTPWTLARLNALNAAVYGQFSAQDPSRETNRPFFVSRTTLSSARYAPRTVAGFLLRLGAPEDQYESEGVFLLRSVLMNPWYDRAKSRGRYFLSELVERLYLAAADEIARSERPPGPVCNPEHTPAPPTARPRVAECQPRSAS